MEPETRQPTPATTPSPPVGGTTGAGSTPSQTADAPDIAAIEEEAKRLRAELAELDKTIRSGVGKPNPAPVAPPPGPTNTSPSTAPMSGDAAVPEPPPVLPSRPIAPTSNAQSEAHPQPAPPGDLRDWQEVPIGHDEGAAPEAVAVTPRASRTTTPASPSGDNLSALRSEVQFGARPRTTSPEPEDPFDVQGFVPDATQPTPQTTPQNTPQSNVDTVDADADPAPTQEVPPEPAALTSQEPAAPAPAAPPTDTTQRAESFFDTVSWQSHNQDALAQLEHARKHSVPSTPPAAPAPPPQAPPQSAPPQQQGAVPSQAHPPAAPQEAAAPEASQRVARDAQKNTTPRARVVDLRTLVHSEHPQPTPMSTPQTSQQELSTHEGSASSAEERGPTFDTMLTKAVESDDAPTHPPSTTPTTTPNASASPELHAENHVSEHGDVVEDEPLFPTTKDESSGETTLDLSQPLQDERGAINELDRFSPTPHGAPPVNTPAVHAPDVAATQRPLQPSQSERRVPPQKNTPTQRAQEIPTVEKPTPTPPPPQSVSSPTPAEQPRMVPPADTLPSATPLSPPPPEPHQAPPATPHQEMPSPQAPTTPPAEKEHLASPLRDQVGEEKQGTSPTAAPTPAPATSQPTGPAPALTAAPPIPAALKQESVQLDGETTPPPSSTLRPIRTFKDDLEQTVQRRATSVVDVATAEENKKNQNKKRSVPKQRAGNGTIIKVALISLFTGMTLVIGFFLFGFDFTPSEDVFDVEIPEYVFAEDNKEIDVTGLARRELLLTLEREVENVDVRQGAIANLYLVRKETLEDGGELTTHVPTAELLSTFSETLPFELSEYLDDVPMFGVHARVRPAPFFIFKTVHFGNVFSGMTKWEETMQADLAPLFGDAIEVTPQLRSATSTLPDRNEPTPGVWIDDVVSNKDVRVLRDQRGEVVLLHSFINPQTIVITTNEETFSQLVERASTRTY